MAVAQSLTAAERAMLSDDAEARLDRLLSFDEDVDDGWEDWPYDHYPGDCEPLHLTDGRDLTDEEYADLFAAFEAHEEPSRRGD